MDKELKRLSKSAEEVTGYLKALSHKTRLLMLCFIGEEEKSVQQLEGFLETSQSNVSQHLAKLRDKGILKTRKDANVVFYSIKDIRVLNLVRALQSHFC